MNCKPFSILIEIKSLTFEINRLNELHVQYIKAELRGFWIKKKIKVIVNP